MIAALALAAALACNPPAGWQAIARAPQRFVVVGEQHGTREAPAAVGELACALSRRGRLLVAVELFSAGDAALQAAWQAPHDGFAVRLRELKDWPTGAGGGPASSALFAMLVRLHAAKARGAPIAVVAFTGPRDGGQAQRLDEPAPGRFEAYQAENIRRAAAAGRYAHVLVLVGNLHARKLPRVNGPSGYAPMAQRLAPADDVLSLDLASSGGTAFNCMLKPGATPAGTVTPDMLDCAAHPYGKLNDVGGHARIVSQPGEGDPAYDGLLYVGAISASAPLSP